MTKYEELKKIICEALPRLMDAAIGQKYIRNTILYELAELSKYGCVVRCLADMKYSIYADYELESGFTTLGIDPSLSEVLEFLQKSDCDIRYINKYGIFHTRRQEPLIDWDLSKPLLKDQSDELIDYLLKIAKDGTPHD